MFLLATLPGVARAEVDPADACASSGLAGTLRVVSASPADPGFHVVTGGEWFQEHGFIRAGHSHERTQTSMAFGFGLSEHVEISAQVLATTNHDSSTSPLFIAAAGDLDLGARVVLPLVQSDSARLSGGLRGGVKIMQGDAPGSRLGDAASPYVRGLLSLETGPLRTSVDAGYYVDRSKNILPATITPDAGQAYAYGIDTYNAVVGGVAIDAPGWSFGPLLEVTMRNDLGGAPGSPVVIATGGARWTTAGGRFALAGALDVGLSGREVEPGRVRAPGYNVVGAATFRFGARSRRTTSPTRVTIDSTPTTGTLRGRVLNDETGGAIEGVTILLDDGRTVLTDASGRFEFPPIRKGPVKLAVRHPQFEGRGKTAFVTAGQPTTLMFRLTRIAPPEKGTARLFGAVVNPEGRFVAATFSLSAAGEEKRLQTDPDGKFRINLPVGAYAIAFSAAGYETKTEVGILEADQESPLTVRLQRATGGASAIRTPPVETRPSGVVGGRITGKDGAPLRAIVAIRAGGKIQSVTCGPDGNYQAEVAAGDVEIAVSAIGYATQTLRGKLSANQGLKLDVGLLRPGQKPPPAPPNRK